MRLGPPEAATFAVEDMLTLWLKVDGLVVLELGRNPVPSMGTRRLFPYSESKIMLPFTACLRAMSWLRSTDPPQVSARFPGHGVLHT